MWAVACASCGGDGETDREQLYRLVSSGAVQRAHACLAVREAEQSIWKGYMPTVLWQVLRERIDAAESEHVMRCLDEIVEYNACFSELPCDAFEERTQPAWVEGINFAPCGCGVVDFAPAPGPFVDTLGPLPDSLAWCAGLLPLSHPAPGPMFTCP